MQNSRRFGFVLAVLCTVLVLLQFANAGFGQEASTPANIEGTPATVAPVANKPLMDVKYLVYWAIAFGASIWALVQARKFFVEMKSADPGTATMVKIAGYVSDGANAYLRQQYKTVFFFFVVISVLLGLQAFYFNAQSRFVPFAFLTGGLFSGLAGWFGMKTATLASNRTAAACQKSLNQGLQVAFRSGAVMGLVVVGLGLIDICLWFAFLYWVWPMLNGLGGLVATPLSLEQITVAMLCFGMGASSQALFARVGGGIFTKAADVGADLVGKVEQGIPEDDPRNPATIADNVGDNVGDVAGMGADLYESYCGSILASAALGVAAYGSGALDMGGIDKVNAQLQTIFLPMLIAGVGIFLSIAGMFMVRTTEEATQRNLLTALAKGINFSTLLTIVAGIVLSYLLMPHTKGTLVFGIPGVAMSIIVGAVAGWLIGKWTEYSTSDEYAPTRKLADQAVTGPATIIIGGIAEGMISTWAPVIVVCIATILSFGFAAGWNFTDMQYFALGLYGVGIAAVGMLATLGITLATDAYGPIADNAGGNAQMSGLEPIVRERTDALDSLGNTTAATGKGFAIGSAALTALALLAAYVEEVRVGFERWGQEVTEKAEPGIYKLSHQFIVRKTSEGKPDYWLVFPSDISDARVRDAWYGVKLAKDPPKLSGDLIRDNGDSLELAASGAKLVNLHMATLPEFARFYDANLMNPKVLVGCFLGAMATFIFCALTMKAVGRAAKQMVEEVRRQFREKPGIMQGTQEADYAGPVRISTLAAQREMVIPSLLALATPVLVGLVLDVSGVMGLLVGGMTCGFCVAVFMSNAGGAWDNAKKYIEAGAHGGKGTEAHRAAVVGDTVGDPFKDTSGPSLNILIKLMSMVSVVAAGLVVRYSLASLGVF